MLPVRAMDLRTRILDWLADTQFRKPWLIVAVAVLIGAGSIPVVKKLTLNSDFTALLPRNKPSVQDLVLAGNRVGGLNTLTLAVQSNDVDALQHFARALVPKLEALRGDSNKVRSVDYNIAAYEDFVSEHKYLYAKLKDLTEVRDSLQERIDWEKARANPFYVDLDDAPPDSPREIVERIRKEADDGKGKLAKFPGGFYINDDHNLLAIFIRTDITNGDTVNAAKLISTVEGEVKALKPTSFAPDLKVEYAGDLLVGREEHDAIQHELVIATTLTIFLVLLSIYLFFWRIRSIVVLGLGLVVPVLATFAFAKYAVDYLNTSTAFLGSIVVGNGINPHIVWLARYFEERRRGLDILGSLRAAHHTTFAGTLSASSAAALAYGSLVITDFRGFRDFGIIGGVGMIFCWIGVFTITPALTSLYERMRELRFKPGFTARGSYGVAFAKIVFGAPRSVIAAYVAIGIASIGLTAWAIAKDPLEYDFQKLRSIRESSSNASKLNGRVGGIVGKAGSGNSIALLVEKREYTKPLRDALEKARDHAHAAYGKVRSIDDLLPADQPEKIALLADIRRLLIDARRYAKEADLHDIDENTPPENIQILGDADLPEEVARPYTERDGTRGTLIFVEQQDGPSVWDGRYLVAWAKSIRGVRVPGQPRPVLVGRAPVFADIIEVIWTDGPKAVLASFFATLLIVWFTFRRGSDRALTMFSLLFGVVWMAGTMAALGMKLNFLNFVAFPVTFGISVDYAVNVMKRWAQDRDGSDKEHALRGALEETGGAVILCSLTTIIGYLSLWTSANLALNSFGFAMGISEVTCLLSACIALPSLLLLIVRRQAKNQQH